MGRPNTYGPTAAADKSSALASQALARTGGTAENTASRAAAVFAQQAATDAAAAKSAVDKANAQKPPAASGDKIYSIENFKFTVDGDTFAVMNIQLTLQLSGIPTAVITINPKPNPNPATVESAGIDDFANWMSALQAKVNTPKGKASLSFTVASTDGETQVVNLTDWPLTQVGFGNIAATGGFNTYVILQHPIYRATTAMLAMLNNYNATAETEDITESDIASMIIECMEIYLKQKDPSDSTAKEDWEDDEQLPSSVSLEELDKIIHKKATEAVAALKANIEWDPDYTRDNVPFLSVVDNFLEYLTTLGGLSVDGYLFEQNSPYDTFMSMTNQMMLVTYSEWSNSKVKIGPIEPWAKPVMKIYADEVSQIDLPPYAVNPISAVAVVGAASTNDYLNTAAGTIGAGTELLGSNAVIWGGYFEKANVLEGYVRVIQTPAWIADYARGKPPGSANDNEKDFNATPNNGGQDPKADQARLELTADLSAVLNAYCEDEFWNRYRADTATSMGLRLLINKGNLALRPGHVIELCSPDEKPILACYIIQVVHTISVADAKAYTSITGNRVRGAQGIQGVYKWDEDRKSVIYSPSDSPPAKKTPLPMGNKMKQAAPKSESTPPEAYASFASGTMAAAAAAASATK